MDKSKMMMGIIIALLVLLIITVVGVSIWLVNQSHRSGDNGGFVIGNTGDPTIRDIQTVSLGSMTANLALGPNGRSDNLVVTVDIGLDTRGDEAYFEEFYADLNRNIPAARSEVLNVFVSRTYEEIRTLEGRQETAEILKNHLQEAFGSNLIVTVMFPEWTAVRGTVR